MLTYQDDGVTHRAAWTDLTMRVPALLLVMMPGPGCVWVYALLLRALATLTISGDHLALMVFCTRLVMR